MKQCRELSKQTGEVKQRQHKAQPAMLGRSPGATLPSWLGLGLGTAAPVPRPRSCSPWLRAMGAASEMDLALWVCETALTHCDGMMWFPWENRVAAGFE